MYSTAYQLSEASQAMTDTAMNVNVQTTSGGDKPPKDSLAQAATWWMTRPWANTLAVLAPISFIVSGSMLFRYQTLIGRPELLFQAVASPAALAVVLTTGLVMLLLPVVMIFGSTWFADVATSFYTKPEVKVPKKMHWVLFTGSVIWLLTVFTSSMLNNNVLLSIVYIVLFVAFPVAGAMIEANTWRLISSKGTAARGLGVGFTFWIAVMASSMAPLVLLVLRPTLPAGARGNVVALTLIFFLMLTGLGGGWRLFHDFAQGELLAEVRKRVLLGGLACVGFFALLAFHTLDMQALRALGVYSTDSSEFVIATPGLLSDFDAAGFKTTRQLDNHPGKVVAPGDGYLYLATAFVRYRFGNQLVLCTTTFDPLQAAPPLLKGCLDVRTDEVRRIITSAS